jgi:hypothetical protein
VSLSDWIKPNRGYEPATATYATNATEKLKSFEFGDSVALVAPVAVAKPKKLKPKERDYLLNWLDLIGEINPDEIKYTLDQCERDPEAREWFMSRAYKLSLFRIDHDACVNPFRRGRYR